MSGGRPGAATPGGRGAPAAPSLADSQNAFHHAFSGYVNGGHRRSWAGRRVRGRVQPAELVEGYQTLRALEARPAHSEPAHSEPAHSEPAHSDASDPRGAERIEWRIEPYAGGNPHVQRLSAYLQRTCAGGLVGAYVHGSLGSYEEVAYSDFDALVVVDDDLLLDPDGLARTARALDRARTFMYAQDPLQHHGWFVLTAFDLRNYCDAYFPQVLFRHAKSLLPGQGERLALQPRGASGEVYESFRSLAAGVEGALRRGRPPRNLYALKNLLSQFMLLPALYVQVRDREGVWKADSFDRARVDFTADEWRSMEQASGIRDAWHYRVPRVQRRLMASAQPWGHFVRKHAPTPIPPPIASLLTPGFFDGMARLTVRMQRLAARYQQRGPAGRPAADPASGVPAERWHTGAEPGRDRLTPREKR